MSDPDAVTAIYWALIFIALMLALAYVCNRRIKRNRYRGLPPPSPLCSRGFDYK